MYLNTNFGRECQLVREPCVVVPVISVAASGTTAAVSVAMPAIMAAAMAIFAAAVALAGPMGGGC